MGKTFGLMAVDWEQRVDLDRLRRERLDRISKLLDESELGALLCFDMGNIRYITATHIGTWAMDKLARFTLLVRGQKPIVWDFGSAARHHALYCPWLEDRTPAGHLDHARGDVARESAAPRTSPPRSSASSTATGWPASRSAIDVVEPAVLFALQAAGVTVADGQQLMQRARVIKTQDEIVLLDTACMMVDAAYEELYRAMRPGMRENECVGLVNKVLYDLGSEHVEGVNAISGERANPHPHVYSDRVLRPGDPAYFDILHSYLGYRTCYYRTFAVGSASRSQVDAYRRCRDLLDQAIDVVRPGSDDRRGRIGLAASRGVRVRQRGGGVRAAVRARSRPLDLGEADHQPPGLARPPRGDRGGHGVCAGDVLAGQRRVVSVADRGAARRHGGRLRGDHPLPGRAADGRRTRVTIYTTSGQLPGIRETQSNLNRPNNGGDKP